LFPTRASEENAANVTAYGMSITFPDGPPWVLPGKQWFNNGMLLPTTIPEQPHPFFSLNE
jgi:hypothetical protein